MKALKGLATALALVSASADAAVDENLRRHAIEYAGLIAHAHDVLADHIEVRSTGAVSWEGEAIPDTETGWRAAWTDTGLRARYCDGELLVYMSEAAPKGVGTHHRDIQMAPRLYLGLSDTGLTLPPLHWLDGRRVEGEGLGTATLPPCMESLYSELLPLGRAALLRSVADPWLEHRTGERFEVRDVACGQGRHGGGVRERRRVSRERNGRGDWTSDPVYGPWEVLSDTCRDDHVYHRTFTENCAWFQGAPFNREMHGVRRWRQAIEVSAYGEQELGAPELMGTTCWDETGGPEVLGDPRTVVASATQEDERACDDGFTGSVWFERTETTTMTTVPWDSASFVTVDYSSWQEVDNTCELEQATEDSDDAISPGPGEGGGGCPSCGRPGDPCEGQGFF